MPPLNLVYVHAHDAGRYVQPYGYPVATPGLQQLAEEGVLFRQAFCAAPTCSASRAALLTGQSAHSAGMYGLAHPQMGGFRLNDYRQHLVATLRAAGYHTVLGGVQHEAANEAWLGYDEALQPRHGHAAGVAENAEAFLARAPREPFFLSVGCGEPHRRMGPQEQHGPFNQGGPLGDPRYTRPPAIFPDTPTTRADIADFFVAVQRFDALVGRVRAALAARGLLERTLIIATTDHGIAFPLMKCHLTDHGLGVLLILRGPAPFAGGRVLDSLVSHVDVFPTLCELLGVAPPPWLEGVSLLPLLRGERDEVRDEVFGEVTYHVEYDPQRAVRTRRWKYVRRFDEVSCPASARGVKDSGGRSMYSVLPNMDPGPTKDLLVRHGLADRRPPREQLYDLVFDPQEAHNLAADPAHAAVLADMHGRLDRWMRRTHDPLLGPAAPPPLHPF